MTEQPNRHLTLLRRALLANALFSSLCAVVFITASSGVAYLVGAPRTDIVATGVGLVIFVAMIAWVLTRRDPLKRRVLTVAAVIAGFDVLWVSTTPLNIAAYTTAGKWLFGGIAFVVAVLAVLQIRGLIGIVRGQRDRSVAATR